MTFLAPLPLAVLLFTWIAARLVRPCRARQALYLVASGVFYFGFGGWFLAVLAASTLFNFFWGGLLRRRPTAGVLFAGILLNAALLGTFKYLPPLAAFWAGKSLLAARLGELALPVGISFWTFQGLSYLFDQYRGEELDPSLLEFCVYMTFAPTVLSGPICRVSDLVPQLRGPFRGKWRDISAGAQSMWIGVWMIQLARLIGSGIDGKGVNWAFEQASAWGSLDVWILLLGYGFQLFFDFAGYSRLVIGIAQLFGIRLPENFDRPFLSPTPTIFWQRWHMSLSFWIRDYLFVPLAMMRHDLWWRHAMLVVSMVVFGLWHKASWLFLLWGLYQGTLLLLHRLWQQHSTRLQIVVPSALSWLVTFGTITAGWIAFRAKDAEQAQALLAAALQPLAHPGLHLPASVTAPVLLLVGGYFAWQGLAAALGKGERAGTLGWIPLEARFALYGLISYTALFYRSRAEAFIYFQFWNEDMTRLLMAVRLLVSLALVLVVWEVAARVDDRVSMGAPLLGPYSPNVLYTNDALGMRGKPHARYSKWRFNSLGYRGPELDPERIHVATLGSSETSGLYEAEDHEYPRQLEHGAQRARRP